MTDVKMRTVASPNGHEEDASRLINVVLCLHNRILRESLRKSLSDLPELSVTTSAILEADVLATLKNDDVDVVIIGSPTINAVAEKAGLLDNYHARVVVIVQSGTSSQDLRKFFSLGCSAVVPNDARMQDLVSVVYLVTRDLTVYPKSLVSPSPSTLTRERPKDSINLSVRESAVLQSLARGLSEIETSVELGIGLRTVHTYLDRLKSKLKAKNRVHAVAIAVSQGLIPFSDGSSEQR